MLTKPLLTKTISFYFSMFVFIAMICTRKTFLGEANMSIIFRLFETFNEIFKKYFWEK